MRKTGICTKCSHNKLVSIGRVADRGRLESEIYDMYLAVVFVADGFFGERREHAGQLSAVVCRACGFTEFYVLDPDSITPDGKYITELTGPDSTTPFR